MTIFDSNTDKVVSDNELARLGLSSTSPVLRQLGYYPLVYDVPEYDVATQSIEFDGPPRLNEDGTEYVQHYIAVTLSGDAALSSLEAVRTAKFADFDRVFQHLDQLKIRPASSITESISKGLTPDPGDVYVLSETQAVTEENRKRRDLVKSAETVEAVRAVKVWWPEQ